jgi:hypothetical protein
MGNKQTMKHAEKLAKENVVYGESVGNYVFGYMKAIEENKVPEVLQSLVNLQKRLELLILYTPSGEERNRMTDENMLALSLINELS